MSCSPFLYEWNGEAMVPLPYFRRQADKQFVVHEHYRLEVVEQRSVESHRHYFACINEAFANLPEIHKGRWQTADDLRKWALCQTEFRDEVNYIAKTKAEAKRWARELGRMKDFAVIVIVRNMVVRYTPKSQSYQDMTKKEFQASKDAVLDVLATLLQIDVNELSSNAGRAA